MTDFDRRENQEMGGGRDGGRGRGRGRGGRGPPGGGRGGGPVLCYHNRRGGCTFGLRCTNTHTACPQFLNCFDESCEFGHPPPAFKVAFNDHVQKIFDLQKRRNDIAQLLHQNGVPRDASALSAEKNTVEGLVEVAENQQKEFLTVQEGKVDPARYAREIYRLKTGLPFYAFRSHVVNTVLTNNVTIIIGETGSGKSTQIAPFLLDGIIQLGEKGRLGTKGGKIVVTQPRNLAVTELSKRVATEWGGEQVGVIGKFRRGKGGKEKIGFCTDARLLHELRDNPLLEGVDCVVVDEVHERSVNTDLVLGCLKNVLRSRR